MIETIDNRIRGRGPSTVLTPSQSLGAAREVHLFVSVKTVDYHLQNVYRKLNLRSRTELAVRVSQATPN